jgi:hypothetical protein
MTPPREETSAEREQWSGSGYVIVRAALTTAQLADLRGYASRHLPAPASTGPGQLAEHAAAGDLLAPLDRIGRLAATLLGADAVGSNVSLRAAYGRTAEPAADTLTRADATDPGNTLRLTLYLSDVTLNDGPLFVVSSAAATAHLTAVRTPDSARTAHLWEVPVCAPAGTVVLHRPDLFTRLANRRVADGWRLTAHATFGVAAAPAGPRATVAVDALATTH